MASSYRASSPSILNRPITHVSYVVDDIPTAVERWVSAFGAGPFFLLDHIEFDEIMSGGSGVSWDHSAAIGQWGPIAVELHQTYRIEPESLIERLAGRGQGVDHIGYLADNLGEESARLNRLGLPTFLQARVGPIEMSFHDAPAFAHAIEVQQNGAPVTEFFDAIANAAQGWGGADHLRVMPLL
jgi:methylmalonyl-CoA/ethylmalonyl-CoA epimerase